jgi:hypothetical protein
MAVINAKHRNCLFFCFAHNNIEQDFYIEGCKLVKILFYYKYKKMNSPETEENLSDNSVKINNKDNAEVVTLQLDDVIKIVDPDNDELNGNDFLIDYIDTNKIRLINTETLNIILLTIGPDRTLGDGTITNITIVSRNDKLGYARQNGLLPGTWINIFFGGETPAVITGEITNVEEDMIEIRCYPDNETIYINFDYKGLPEDLPIETIEIREKPTKEIVVDEPEEFAPSEKITEEEQDILRGIPLASVKEQLRSFILKADQIEFGSEELGPISQYVDIDKSQQRFSVEMQTNDLLDEMLSTIPNAQRTTSVLNNIHTMIERFKQLRQKFSTFDDNGNIIGSLRKESSYKPLVNELIHFKTLLYWLLPVVKNVKKVYNISPNTEDDEYPDTILLNTTQSVQYVKTIIGNYQSNEFPDEQNKYVTFIKEINPYFTPFEELGPENLQDIIYEKEVGNNLNVIIDNLDDFYSSVAEKDIIKMRRFVIQKYNLGINRMNALQITGSKMIAERVPLTSPDQLSLKSIVSLPEPAIRFSRINLPGTNIMDRSNLNEVFLNYWQLLKKNTNVKTIRVDNINDEIDFDAETFVSEIKNYVLTLDETLNVERMSKFDIYKKFLTSIIPKIKVLFALVKKYIHGKLSIVDIIGYLEPFLVYTDDLTYQQYSSIKSFLDEKISLFNKTFVDRSRSFASIKNVRNNVTLKPSASAIYNIFPTKDNSIGERVFDNYDYHGTSSTYKLTNSELLERIIIKDSGRLYNSAISITTIPLMFPDNLSTIFDAAKEQVKEEKNSENNDKCVTYVIAKQYRTLDELLSDNDKEIYFDKKYDTTNYSLLDQYENDMIKMGPEEFAIFLVKKLEVTQKISQLDAEYLANTLISGVKNVKEGNYAIVYDTQNGNFDGLQYYKRTNQRWVLDEKIDKNSFANDDNLLCNVQSECIDVQKNIANECETIAINEKKLIENSIDQIMNSFDKKYYSSKQTLETEIMRAFDYYLSTFDKLNEIEFTRKFQYNNKQFSIGSKIAEDEKDVVVSPFQKFLDIIIGQSDFVKKQFDIIKFGNMFTREAVDGSEETPHWRYCVKTGTELLPTFRFTLANAFQIGHETYKNALASLKQTNGKLSDDESSWIDKYTGREICARDLDVDEGYENGFKASSRAQMEQDVGDAIVSAEKKAPKRETLEVKMMNNIISHMATSMAINMEDQREFIIQNVSAAIQVTLPSEAQHKIEMQKMAKQGKTPPSYEDIYNAAILYTTMGMFLIATQTSIPSIRTKKTFPGCVKSFNGFPIEGAGDDSSLEYLACVAYKVRNNTNPWRVLMKRKTSFIVEKIRDVIQKTLLALPGVIRKFEEKTEYLLLNPIENIPKEHDISGWTQFLPPLVKIKLTGLANVTSEFKSKLVDDLKIGSTSQREKLLIVESKIIQFSLAIQEAIQEIIDHKKLLLTNSANEPFVENSCCNENSSVSTIDYFIKENGDIESYNKIVENLSNILVDVQTLAKSPLFFSKENTKNIYPVLSNQEFTEETIYRAFIIYCKFTSLVPIGEDLIALCTSKPEYVSSKDSIVEIIAKLKRDGRNYTNDTFLRLLQIVNRKNIVNVNIDPHITTFVQNITKLLEHFGDQDEEVVYPALRKLIDLTLDTYDVAVNEDNEDMRNLKNHLSRTNETMKIEITEFIKKNNSLTGKRDKYIDTLLREIFTWNDAEENTKTISDSKTYNFINFIKSYMQNFYKTFPNIILNNVDYDKVQVQDYWHLSQNHVKDIKKIVKDYYQRLRPFYSEKVITNVLTTLQQRVANLMRLVCQTPYYTSIQYKNQERHSIFDKTTADLLFEQYFLLLLTEYMNLTENESMLFYETEGNGVSSVEDIFTVEDLEERETKTNVVNVRSENEMTLQGNKKELKTKTANLLLTYLNIMLDHKDLIDKSYTEIMDKVFKISEREKDTFTDRLKVMTDEERDADTILKINKLGVWSKGLQKGLTKYTKETYDDERDVMDKIAEIERSVRKNTNVTDGNVDMYVDDYLEQMDADADAENEAYDMSLMTEDYDNGNFESDEVEDYEDHY